MPQNEAHVWRIQKTPIIIRLIVEGQGPTHSKLKYVCKYTWVKNIYPSFPSTLILYVKSSDQFNY